MALYRTLFSGTKPFRATKRVDGARDGSLRYRRARSDERSSYRLCRGIRRSGEGMQHGPVLRPMLIGIGLAALVFLAYQQGWLSVLELRTLDARFRLRGSIAPQLPIVIVSIDQDSFDELNIPWPWPRTLHAELIRALAASQAKLIAVDILFTEPKADAAEDAALAAAMRASGNVILAAEYTSVPSAFGPRTTMNLPIPLFRQQALGYGPVNLFPDEDGVVRSAPLGLWFQNRLYPAFAYQIYRRAVADAGGAAEGEAALYPALYYINFRGPARTFPIVPYYRILRGEIEPAVFREKIVLVGALAASLHDLYPTPYSASQPTSGVEIQANVVETLAADDPIVPFAGRRYAALYTLLAATTLWSAHMATPWRALAAIMGLACGYGLAALWLFAHAQLWIPLVPSWLGMVLPYGGVTLERYVREQRERLRLRAIFGRYVSPDVVEELLESRDGLALGGRRRRITVLFSDVRGFTSIAERIAPEQVVTFLSEFLAQATDIVFKHGGTVDKFMGDAIMAIFGAPKAHADDALRAVRAGLDIIRMAEALDAKWSAILGCPLRVGVALNSGEAVVGSIGSEVRSDFTAIGDTVNLAARLEGLTKAVGIPLLLSEFTAAELGDRLPLKPLHRVRVAGREAPVLLYTVDGAFDGTGESAVDPAAPHVQPRR
jgi:adenylate cyclase